MNDYEKFQLKWMIDHDHSLRELMEELQSLQYEDPEDSDRISSPITELFQEWEADRGLALKSGRVKRNMRKETRSTAIWTSSTRW